MEIKKHQKSELLNILPVKFKTDLTKYLQMENIFEAAMKEIITRIEILDNEYELKSERNPIHHLENRIKSPESIFGKLRRYGYQESLDSAIDNIYDIAGIRVVTYHIDDCYTILNNLQKQDDLEFLEIKDYIKNPKPSGYRSLHVILKVPIHTIKDKKMVLVEVQLRSMAMDYFASLEHQLKYKENNVSKKVKKELEEVALKINETDEIMQKIFNSINEQS